MPVIKSVSKRKPIVRPSGRIKEAGAQSEFTSRQIFAIGEEISITDQAGMEINCAKVLAALPIQSKPGWFDVTIEILS